MRKPPKALLPLIELASIRETSVDALLAALRTVDAGQLKRNAFHVLQAIPEVNDTANGIIKFGAVHHVVGSDSSVFGSLCDTCVRGSMGDAEASEAVGYMIEQGWMPKVPGLIINACAYAKPISAARFHALGLYPIAGVNWGSMITYIEDVRILPMVKLLIEVVQPERSDLLKLRLAVKASSPAAILLDQHLALPVVANGSATRH